MNNKIVLGIVAVLVAAGIGGYFVFGTSKGESVNNTQPSVVQDVSNRDSSQESDASEVPKASLSNYRQFDADQFEEAKAQGKVTMLYFTANWCPICKVQIPVNAEALKELEGDEDIVVFEAHILDSETTEITEDLAKEYGVRLQHTFVIINPSGEAVFTHTGPLTKEDITENLLSAKVQ